MRKSRKPLVLAGALLCSLMLSPAMASAEVQVSTNTPYVCHWFFDEGPWPRSGQVGTESRAWIGFAPEYFTAAWFSDGHAIGYPIHYWFLSQEPGGGSSHWYVEAYYEGETITGFAEIDLLNLPYANSRSSNVVDLSNHGNLFCQELNGQAQKHLWTAYAATGSACACGPEFLYGRTVDCVEGCAEEWNRNWRWIGPAPDCLDSPEVTDLLICLLSNDPRIARPPANCGLFPDDPRCQ